MTAFSEKTSMRGVVERRRFDTERLDHVRLILATEQLSDDEKDQLFDWAAKPMFAENRLWRLIRKWLGIDLRIAGLTGVWTKQAILCNTITNVGKKISAEQVGGTTTAPVTAIAIGIGTPSATALGSEITTNGGQRGAATVTNQTTSSTGDTEQWVKTFNFTGTFAVTEEGLFDNNTSGGNMLASQSFSAINVISGDSVQFTHKVQYS